ncbi:hypothetical protein ACTFIN_14855 [Clostridium cagae]|uniref:hypothetical protein n=1 Tax=Clostridium TaxID=1485 RepID=UPI00050838EA|nr:MULTISPECIES: hypothetical protein [unclassified Clostridium]AIY82127.1 putative membrane protein [Clostridium botulinum 202F]KAI3345263.1 hypothetical protein CIT17_13630 [Clostridium botulinum]KFX57763.1 hypothetical protein KU40_05525 [Clostridium botulinum]KON11537.1 hypothetical protein ACP50_17185 [Clostridium botulinum]MBY6780176.1 hypothetical protein [Clostridium botulinum]
MQKYSDLIIGLVCGIVLTLLNNDIVHRSLGSIFTLFDPNNLNTITIFLIFWSSRLIIILSFIGILITIICSILLIIKAIKND